MLSHNLKLRERPMRSRQHHTEIVKTLPDHFRAHAIAYQSANRL